MTPIPEDTLRAVYRREQPYRYHWPASYEEGMGDPIISRIVELLARHQVPAFGRRHADRARIGLGQGRQASLEQVKAQHCLCPSVFTDEDCRRIKAQANVICWRESQAQQYQPAPLSNKDRAAGERLDCKVCNGTGIAPDHYILPIVPGKTYPACEHCNGTGHE